MGNDTIHLRKKMPDVLDTMLRAVEPIMEHSAEVFTEAFTEPEPPAFWIKGQMLNIRNNGEHFIVTLYPEEFDPRHPERALRFPNSARAQDFISAWYSREHFDPRAR
jgi:hypothetical protein